MIFPTLRGKKGVYVNLNELARAWLNAKGIKAPTPNPLLDAAACQEMINTYHRSQEAAYSFGGWLEDRSVIWGGSYLEESGSFVHLGIDCNAPAGTSVAIDVDATVLRIDHDPTTGGWGTRIMAMADRYHVVLLYAHLAPEVRCNVGKLLKPGDLLGHIGGAEVNGRWFPHVHVQALRLDAYEEFERDPDSLDGYASVAEPTLTRFMAPMPYVRID